MTLILYLTMMVRMIATSSEPSAIDPSEVVHARERGPQTAGRQRQPPRKAVRGSWYQWPMAPQVVTREMLMSTSCPQKKESTAAQFIRKKTRAPWLAAEARVSSRHGGRPGEEAASSSSDFFGAGRCHRLSPDEDDEDGADESCWSDDVGAGDDMAARGAEAGGGSGCAEEP